MTRPGVPLVLRDFASVGVLGRDVQDGFEDAGGGGGGVSGTDVSDEC